MYKIYSEPATTSSSGLFRGKCGVILETVRNHVSSQSADHWLLVLFVALLINKMLSFYNGY